MRSKVTEEDANIVISALGESINHLSGKSLLLTGASGFFGIALLDALVVFNSINVTNPCKITALSRSRDRIYKIAPHLINDKNINFVSSDVRQYVFPKERFDFIIHAASPVDPVVLSLNRLDCGDIIITGTRKILEESTKNKPEKILFVSSGAVYGAQSPDVKLIDENLSGGPVLNNPASIYAEAKRYAETLCCIFAEEHNLKISIARPFTFVGPYQDINSGFAVSQFIKAVLKRESIIIQGDGTALRSYCYSADLVIGLLKILLNDQKGGIYNIGSDKEISIFGLALEIIKIIGVECNIEVKKVADPKRKPARYIPDISLIRSELSFDLKFNLNESLRRTINWMQANLKKGVI
jgi:dTDP-glucose 4,6-dehydratase